MKIRSGFFAVIALLAATAQDASAGLLADWNFNTTTSMTTLFTASSGSAAASATMSTNFVTPTTNVTSFSGTTVNAAGGDTAGSALALLAGASEANNGMYLQFGVSTVGASGIVVSYATQGTTTGFMTDQFEYSTDGTTFSTFNPTYIPPSSFGLETFNLSSVAGLNNNANAMFRIVFSGATGSSGNNRIDNLQIASVPEPASLTMLGLGMVGSIVIARRRKSA